MQNNNNNKSTISYTQRKKNLKLRKKLRKPSELSYEERYLILEKYTQGSTMLDLAEEYNIAFRSMENWFDTFYNSLISTRETNSLITAQNYSKQGGYEVAPTFKNPSAINEEFQALLSDEDSLVPSEAELAYAESYATSGNNKQALLAAGLDAGLKKNSKNINTMYSMRGLYLRNKPCIKDTIQSLQKRIVDDLYVDKSAIQLEIRQQISQLKEIVPDNPRQIGNLIKLIEMLGKTIPGTFSERVEIHKIDKTQSLSKLVEELQAAEIQEIEDGVELITDGRT